jgi:peptidylprolyl isomerase
MTYKLPSIAILAALTTATFAQTTTTTTPKTTAPTTTATHHAATTASKTPVSNIPKVVGIPKTLYALKYIDTKIGTGPLVEASILGSSPADSKIMEYTVKYTGWLTNGTKFDSSEDHPGAAPIAFPAGLHRVIPGWDTGFTGMHLGGKRRLFVPWQLAYGAPGKPPTIPAKSDLIFDIELVSQKDITAQLVRRPTPPAAPGTPAPRPQSAPSATPPAQPATPPQPVTPPQPATPPQPQTPPHPQAL